MQGRRAFVVQFSFSSLGKKRGIEDSLSRSSCQNEGCCGFKVWRRLWAEGEKTIREETTEAE